MPRYHLQWPLKKMTPIARADCLQDKWPGYSLRSEYLHNSSSPDLTWKTVLRPCFCPLFRQLASKTFAAASKRFMESLITFSAKTKMFWQPKVQLDLSKWSLKSEVGIWINSETKAQERSTTKGHSSWLFKISVPHYTTLVTYIM